MVNHATTIRVLAERRMAQLVDEGQRARQVASPGDNPNVRNSDNQKPLPDLGIDRKRLSEARKLARDFTEEQIREAAQVTP
jgi:hypothetical protein